MSHAGNSEEEKSHYFCQIFPIVETGVLTMEKVLIEQQEVFFNILSRLPLYILIFILGIFFFHLNL